MEKILENVLYVIIAIMLFDFVMFMMWAMSGQAPVDGFYFGVITKTVLNLFI